MKGFSISRFNRSPAATTWTRRICSSTIREAAQAKSRLIDSRARPRSGNPFKKGRVLLLASVSTLAVGAVAFTDDLTHAYGATVRSCRVIKTLALCIDDYRRTLNANEGLGDKEEQSKQLMACHQRCADRTLKTLEKNGSIFIKLGQHLSAMSYLLPLPWTATFIPLQDKCPVSSYESIEAMFRLDTGQEITDYFSEFSHEPIGAASLAQVHLARVRKNGLQVAVKVQHPTLSEWANLDLWLTRFTFSALKKFFPEYDLEWLSNELEFSLPQELDFTKEAQNAMRSKEYFCNVPKLPLIIPGVIWAKQRILVMENVSGHRLDDLKYMDANGIDRDEVSAALARIFNEMIFGNGAPLHCDPHGGNIAIRKNENRRGCNFDIILYDHGLYRDIPIELRRSYAKLWLAVIDADEPRMRKYSREVAGITDEDFILFASAITGREFQVIKTDISVARSAEEKKHINQALGEGMLQQLVELLGKVPRIILLILKTNDLTRSLDENLHTRQGPVRTFLILARYCSRTVLEEKLEELRKRGGFLWPSNLISLIGTWLNFIRIEVKLEAFELWLAMKRNRPISIE